MQMKAEEFPKDLLPDVPIPRNSAEEEATGREGQDPGADGGGEASEQAQLQTRAIAQQPASRCGV